MFVLYYEFNTDSKYSPHSTSPHFAVFGQIIIYHLKTIMSINKMVFDRRSIDLYASTCKRFCDLDLSTHHLENIIISSPNYTNYLGKFCMMYRSVQRFRSSGARVRKISTGVTAVTAHHSGDPGVRVRVRVRVIITIIPRNGGPPEWRTRGMTDPNRHCLTLTLTHELEFISQVHQVFL